MKKLIIAIFVALVLGACSQSAGDKFVGTWSGIDSKDDFCKNKKIVIEKNNGGTGYTIKDVNFYEYNYVANLDGDTLIVDAGADGKFPLKVENNQMEWTTMNVGRTKCMVSKKSS